MVGKPDLSMTSQRLDQMTSGAAALLIVTGFVLQAAAGYSADFSEGLLWAGTIGLPGIGIVVAIIWGTTAWLLGRTVRKHVLRRLILTVAFVCGAFMAIDAIRSINPVARFEHRVLKPAPSSLRDLQVRTQTSFNDGDAWLFAFTLSPQDFERVQAAHHLVELNVSDRQTKFRDAVQEFGAEYAQREVFPEIESLVGTGRELFSLPESPRLFLGDKIIAVTDQSRQRVYLLFDNFRRMEPGPPNPATGTAP